MHIYLGVGDDNGDAVTTDLPLCSVMSVACVYVCIERHRVLALREMSSYLPGKLHIYLRRRNCPKI